MRKISLVLILFFSSKAFATLELYAGTSFGFATMDEFSPGYKYDHSSNFDMGLLIGSRYRWQVDSWLLGGVAELGWVGHTIDRRSRGPDASKDYRIETQRILLGPSVAYSLIQDRLAIEAEYYPVYSTTVSYSDEKAGNPNKKGDQRRGSGWGLGMSFKFWICRVTGMYRQLQVKSADHGNAATSPVPTYGDFTAHEGVATFGFEFF